MSDRPLRVVVAPDSFGGALASPGVADAIAAGWARARPADMLDLAPMADGGEGTLEALSVALGDRAERRTITTVDALGRPVDADWLLIDEGEAAFVEMATASGLARLAVDERTPANARVASSRGTGDLLRGRARRRRARSITLGLGGSATTDGGSGMLVALGARLLDESGEELPPGGAALARLARIDVGGLDPRLGEVAMTVASGRDQPAVRPGRRGRDLRPAEGLRRVRRSRSWIARCCTGAAPIEQRDGTCRSPTCRAQERPAARPPACSASPTRSSGPASRWWPTRWGWPTLLAAADLVITGEGRADEQTLSGKAAMGVAALRARQCDAGRPAVRRPGAGRRRAGCVGRVRGGAADRRPADAPGGVDGDTERLLANAAERVARTVQVGLLLAEPGA